MELPFFQVDAFAYAPFTGNPAAVVVLDCWLPDEQMQSIAAENNLSETAFIIPEGQDYLIRWFAPDAEVPLCGHASLAAGHVVLNHLNPDRTRVNFRSPQYNLAVEKMDGKLWLDFPAFGSTEEVLPDGLKTAIGKDPVEYKKTNYAMLVYNSEEEILAIEPDYEGLIPYDEVGIIVTAPGKNVDFVSRFFAPAVGVNEDPVTGSAHSGLIPYWSARLGKKKLAAKQLSRRGGELECEYLGERVRIGGAAFTVIEGTYFLADEHEQQIAVNQ